MPRRDVSNVREIRNISAVEGGDGKLSVILFKPNGGVPRKSGGLNNILICLEQATLVIAAKCVPCRCDFVVGKLGSER